MDSPGSLVPRSAFLASSGTGPSIDVEPGPSTSGSESPRRRTARPRQDATPPSPPPSKPSSTPSTSPPTTRRRWRIVVMSLVALLSGTAMACGGFYIASRHSAPHAAAVAPPPDATPGDASPAGDDWTAAPALGRPLIGTGVSNGYTLPGAKQGVHDQRYWDGVGLGLPTSAAGAARYAALGAAVAPGTRRYNTFWATFEPDYPPPPPGTPCPAGTVEWARPGVAPPRRHCYSAATINATAAFLAADAAHGVQSVATLWKAPAAARAPGCGGWAPRPGAPRDFSGCAPSTAATLAAFSDFVAFLGDRFRSHTAGRFAGYIVWNEAASSRWFDASGGDGPPLPPPGSPARAAAVGARYAALVNATATALADVNAGPALVFASIDGLWSPPRGGWADGAPHVGSAAIVDALWRELGTRVDWSLALHQYGPVHGDGWPAIYRFKDLPSIAALQRARAADANAVDPDRAPQSVLAATEQGWPAAGADAPAAAGAICAAHAIAMTMPTLAFTTHNDFQGPASGDPTGLTPFEAGPYLNSTAAAASPTLAAYRSTAASVWGRDGGHFCCLVHGLGCGPAEGKF